MSKKVIIMNYILFGIVFIGTIFGIVVSSFALVCSLALSIYFDEIRINMIMIGMMFIVFLFHSIRLLIVEIEEYKKLKKRDKSLKTLENHSST